MFLVEYYSTLPPPYPIAHAHPWGVFWLLKHSPFQMPPEVLNRVNIRGLGRPDKHLDVIVLKPLCCLFRGVFGVIVLLEYPLFLWYLQLLKTFHHSIIQNIIVLLCIHDPLYLCELPYPIPPHTPQYHKIIPSSMLDSGGGGPV